MQITTPESAALIQRLVEELLNHKKTEIAQHLYALDCSGATPEGSYRNRGELLSLLQRYAAAFPDFHVDIDYLAAEGDRVVLHYTFVGTHIGSGLTLRVPSVMISRIVNHRIVRQDFLWDSSWSLDSAVGRAA
jgi:SnoaL-like polyketide cyclase